MKSMQTYTKYHPHWYTPNWTSCPCRFALVSMPVQSMDWILFIIYCCTFRFLGQFDPSWGWMRLDIFIRIFHCLIFDTTCKTMHTSRFAVHHRFGRSLIISILITYGKYYNNIFYNSFWSLLCFKWNLLSISTLTMWVKSMVKLTLAIAMQFVHVCAQECKLLVFMFTSIVGSSIVQLLNMMMRFNPNFLVGSEWVLSNWSGHKTWVLCHSSKLSWNVYAKHINMVWIWLEEKKWFGNELHNVLETWTQYGMGSLLPLCSCLLQLHMDNETPKSNTPPVITVTQTK